MAANIEIKARARDWEELRRRAAALSGTPGELIEQDDTFYAAPNGRLKLRQFTPGRGELIHYERPDAASARASEYTVLPVTDPEAVQALLAAALGVRGRVRKRRWLYLVGQTRVHLDEVEGLGRFVELEYVLRPGEAGEDGHRAVDQIQKQLGIVEGDLVGTAYLDLLGASPR